MRVASFETADPAMSKQSRQSPRRDGCGRLLLTCLTTCLLLAANGVLAAIVVNSISLQGGHWVRESRIAQVFIFVGPVALIFAEWRLLDSIASRWSRKQAMKNVEARRERV
jgi:hypothetical protein